MKGGVLCIGEVVMVTETEGCLEGFERRGTGRPDANDDDDDTDDDADDAETLDCNRGEDFR